MQNGGNHLVGSSSISGGSEGAGTHTAANSAFEDLFSPHYTTALNPIPTAATFEVSGHYTAALNPITPVAAFEISGEDPSATVQQEPVQREAIQGNDESML